MTPRELVSLTTALSLLDKHITAIHRQEQLPLHQALGRVLASDIHAHHSTPPFDRAVMDGYAVIASDLNEASQDNPVTLKVVEEVFAGAIPQKRLSTGLVSQISTGARIPDGADAVVMQEDTKRDGDTVRIFTRTEKAKYISFAGADIRIGELLLGKERLLTPARIGALASQGMESVDVYVKPKVAILSTGEEVVALGQPLKENQIYDINSYSVASVIQLNGGEPWILPTVGDSMLQMQAALEQALQADLVITTGGSSVGTKDYLSELLTAKGNIFYHGIRLKPGKPSAFALVDGKPVLGLPGYPTSCLINAYLLLGPTIRRMAHLPLCKTQTMEIPIAENLSGIEDRTTFLPVKIENEQVFNAFKGSGAITSAAHADGYIVLQPNEELPKGHVVSVTLF